ncbi:Uncharacterized protein TCM_019820 [Theobroma cacao]|uniref:RNase H type-1 domain-containing protein n=1 Tax=Theobroma cacao TaxID=3641 RepID=A0A061EIX8_THECC|nr:Uncharacterized protein TCM_019820 [Theobroma cacao]
MFSKDIGVSDSTTAELLAVREAATIYAASKWCSSSVLVLKCDNRNVVKWLTDPSDVPWRLRAMVIQIWSLLAKVDKWSITHIPRSANDMADTLAKKGVLRPYDFF